MRRRALLASLVAGAAGLAGCPLSGDDDGRTPDDRTRTPTSTARSTTRGDPPATGQSPTSRPTRTNRETPTDRPTTEPGTTAEAPESATESPDPTDRPDRPEIPQTVPSVVGLETGPRVLAFLPRLQRETDGWQAVLWFERTETADGPATLGGFVENRRDEMVTVRLDDVPALRGARARRRDGSGGQRVALVPTAANDLAEALPELARNDRGYWYAETTESWLPETIRLAPGQARTLGYAVVWDRDARDRPSGVYEVPGPEGPTAAFSLWETSLGRSTESRFEGRSLPTLFEDRSVGWYHEADRTTRAYFRPATERFRLDGRLAFSMMHDNREELGCGGWSLYKLVDGEWFYLGDASPLNPCWGPYPGERGDWWLRAFNGRGTDPGQHVPAYAGMTRTHLGGGEYAVAVGWGLDTDWSAALFELVGDPVTIRPTADVTSERLGDVVTVTTGRYGDDDHPQDAAFTLERTESADERLIAEQLVGDRTLADSKRGLRNALPFMESEVERVVVRTDASEVGDALGVGSKPRRFRFRGQDYVASREELE